MSAELERIRRNDPRFTSFEIGSYEDGYTDAEITEALEQNPHIVSLFLYFPRAPQNWPRFLHHLETRNNFREVILYAHPDDPEASIASVLQVLQRNTNVRDITIAGLYVRLRALVSFLNTASHITDLKLYCDFQNNDGNLDGPAFLAASLQRLTNLQTLDLSRGMQAEYLIAIFDSLKLNKKPSPQTLVLDFRAFSDAAWASFKNFMRSTATVRELQETSLPARSKAIFLNIVKSNSSLRVVREHLLPDANTFTEEERRLLAFYADRNQRTDQFIEHPTSVPKQLWPEVLQVAAQADPSVLFRSLIAIRGELGTGKRTRKRKRPAFFKPS